MLKIFKRTFSSKIILKLRKGEELLFWILHKIMEIVCFSTHVHQCQHRLECCTCMYKIVLNLFYLLLYSVCLVDQGSQLSAQLIL